MRSPHPPQRSQHTPCPRLPARLPHANPAPPAAPRAPQYDTDVTTWSPQGRLFQVEYAMEAVKQGSACVGATSRTHAVVAALKRAPSELAAAQQKCFKVDDHAGIVISGLTADGRSLLKCVRARAVDRATRAPRRSPALRAPARARPHTSISTRPPGTCAPSA